LFRLVAEPVLKLETSPDAELTLREIGILLGDILDLLEEDQPTIRAADRLYDAAYALQDAKERRSTCVKITKRLLTNRAELLYAALSGFRVSLASSKPNPRARAQYMVW
jgi:hypothetical protein